jgi:pyridoxamine 5'-phosphate oxidase
MSLLHDLLGMLSSPIAGKSDLPDPPPSEPMGLLRAWLDDATASGKYADPNAMTLATATRYGRPSARVVLCKAIEPTPSVIASPSLVFYTNYQSPKGLELIDNPYAAAVFHWPHAQRQARVEGEVVKTSDAESDEYFKTRHPLSRIGAWASKQSRPLASRGELVAEAMKIAGMMTAGSVGGAVESASKAVEDAMRSVARAVGVSTSSWPTPPPAPPRSPSPDPSRSAGASSLPVTPTDLFRRPPWWGGFRIQIRSVELWSAREGRLHDRFRWELTTPIGASPTAWKVERLSP